jgi:dienelactone hydrolase
MKKILFIFLICYSSISFSEELFTLEVHKSESISAPTVIILHGCSGPGFWTKDWTKRINDWGYNAVVPNQFVKRGYDNVCNRGHVVSPWTRVNDILAIIEWIKQQPWHREKIAIIGASHAGGTTAYVANDPKFTNLISGVALFYPGCRMTKDYANPKVPAIVYLGAKDQWTPCLDGNWQNYEKHVYKDAGHAFDISLGNRVFMGHSLWYDSEAALHSQENTKRFFKRIFAE